MQLQRLAAFLIGIWLGASVLMDFAATANFGTVSRVMTSLDMRMIDAKQANGGEENVRLLLRHFAGEANRYLFEQWEWAELLIGVLLLLALLFGRSYQKLALALCLAMITVVLVQRFKVTPAITSWGRAIDFTNSSSEHFRFYHALYGYLEVSKLLLGVVMVVRLLVRRKADPKAFVRQYESASQA